MKKDTEEMYKAQYVVQENREFEKNMFVHSSSSLKQSSILTLLSIAVLFGFHTCSQDVSQVYLQSEEKLMYDIYVRPSKEFRLPKNAC